MKILESIHAKLGDLWWYTLLLFVAQRFGDVINMFVGLWLVPKYVPQEELGAVLPLAQAVSVIGLPLGILAIPFMKFLDVYNSRGEDGKVKSLLRDVFIGTGVLSLVTLLLAWLVLPFFFERMRVATGMLGVLVVLGSLLTAVATIFGNAVQGLKLYGTTVWFNLLGAPLRLGTMLVMMPFRALSGYFAGQCAPPAVSIVGSIWALRKRMGRAVKALSYWRDDHVAIIRYALPIAVWTIAGSLTCTIESLVIRHRLSDFESAGYYVITRFTDIASYLGSSFIVFLFPMVAGLSAADSRSRRILVHSLLGTAGGGLLVGFVLQFFGDWLLGLSPLWAPYRSLANMMLPICVLNVMSLSCSCFATYEMAQGRFGFFCYVLPLVLLKSAFLYALTGFDFFSGFLPSRWLDVVHAWNPCRLSFVVYFLIGAHVVVIACIVLFEIVRRRVSPMAGLRQTVEEVLDNANE